MYLKNTSKNTFMRMLQAINTISAIKGHPVNALSAILTQYN